jgi:uncharacterized protein YjbI with pentapeptide repeats
MASVKTCKLQDTIFSECKIIGVDFSDCDPLLLSMKFDNCTIQSCSFSQMKLEGTIFQKSIIKECSFIETDLTSASFHGCDLSGTIFNNTILNKADFSEASNYQINLINNQLKQAKFTLPDAIALLEMMGIKVL